MIAAMRRNSETTDAVMVMVFLFAVQLNYQNVNDHTRRCRG